MLFSATINFKQLLTCDVVNVEFYGYEATLLTEAKRKSILSILFPTYHMTVPMMWIFNYNTFQIINYIRNQLFFIMFIDINK